MNYFVYLYNKIVNLKSMSILLPSWENITKSKKATNCYSFESNQTAVFHTRVHELIPFQANEGQTHIYLTCSTFDAQFVLLRSQHQTGKITVDPNFKQQIKMKTDYPIANCFLQYQWLSKKDNIIGYLVDIYSNIYYVEFTKFIDLGIRLGNQPIQYIAIYKNNNEYINMDRLYLKMPLLLAKRELKLITVDLEGHLKLIPDLGQFPSTQIQQCCFQDQVLAATYGKMKNSQGDALIIALKNKKVPLIFVNCKEISQFQKQYALQIKLEWIQETQQITYCQFDAQTNLIAVSLASQQIQIYQITKSFANPKTAFLQKVFGFYINNNLEMGDLIMDYNIENIDIFRGLLMITLCRQYIIFDVASRTIKKRSKNSSLQKLKIGNILDRNENLVSVLLVRGYNHLSEANSKIGKPNLHFKAIDVLARIR